MMESMEEDKAYTKWEWFLYIILLPCLFTLILIGIILTFMKVDIFTPILELGNKIPVIEKIIPDPKVSKEDDYLLYENTLQPSLGKNENSNLQKANEEIARLEEEVKEKEAIISKLQTDLTQAAMQIQQIEAQLMQLKQISEESNAQEQKLKEIVNMYSAMTASKSAPILASMEALQAVEILAQMDSKKASQILAKMDPDRAAELTLLLKESSTSTNDFQIQEQIKQLEQQLTEVKSQKSEVETELDETIRSFELMDRTSAANIFEKMWSSGSKTKVVNILQQLSTETYTRIMEKMTPDVAAAIISEVAR